MGLGKVVRIKRKERKGKVRRKVGLAFPSSGG